MTAFKHTYIPVVVKLFYMEFFYKMIILQKNRKINLSYINFNYYVYTFFILNNISLICIFG